MPCRSDPRSRHPKKAIPMTTDTISPDLKATLRRLKLSRMLDTLPERLTLARQQKMPHQDLLLLVLSDEVARRDSLAVTLRVQKAHLDPTMHLEAWDPTAKVTFDRALLNELTSLRFLDGHAHVAIVGPVGGAPRCWHSAPIRCSKPLSTRGWTIATRSNSARSSRSISCCWTILRSTSWTRPRVATSTRFCSSGIAPARSSSRRIAAPTNGSPPSPIRSDRESVR